MQWRLPVSKLIDGITISSAHDSHEAKIYQDLYFTQSSTLKFTHNREQDLILAFHGQGEYFIHTTLPNM